MSTRPGVSIAISTTYLAGMPKGEDVEVEAKVARVRRELISWLPSAVGLSMMAG
jgi:acyl-coenzyme A thioesterase PaaI-like protein